MTDIELGERQAAREILSMIEEICFSTGYQQFRVDRGCNGVRDMIINSIKGMYLEDND